MCDYQTIRQKNLKPHKKAIHEKVKYSCDKCTFQTSWKKNLKDHKARKHSLIV